MYISVETPEQTEARLRHVMQLSILVWHEGTYSFHEHPVAEFPAGEVEQCLALVRDMDVWSVLMLLLDNATRGNPHGEGVHRWKEKET